MAEKRICTQSWCVAPWPQLLPCTPTTLQLFPVAQGTYIAVMLAHVIVPAVGKAGALHVVVGELMVAIVVSIGTVLTWHSLLPSVHNISRGQRATIRRSMVIVWSVGVLFACVLY